MTKIIDYKKELENQCGPECDCAGDAEAPYLGATAASRSNTEDPCCGPSCECNRPSQRSWGRTGAVLLVVAAAVAIVVVKLAGGGKPAEPAAVAPATEVSPAVEAQPEGVALASLLELNTLANGMDVVFVLAAPQGSRVGDAITKAVSAARQKLEAKGMIVGVYVLRDDSADLPGMSSRHALPGVLVLSRGPGKPLVSGDNVDVGMLTGEITESKLLQAYVAASLGGSGGGCNCAQGSECGGN